MGKSRVATTWLDGCSGCHMSIFDMDERLLDLADKMDVVYSPLVDTKEYPEDVDIALVEGAIGNEEQLYLAHTIRNRTKIFVSLGDCAVTGNIVAYRNPFPVADVITQVFFETSEGGATAPDCSVPSLLPFAVPIHEIIDVDVFVPGCPPSADLIHYIITELLEERQPDTKNYFG
ncbi:MAG: NADP oxidoreductase [Rubrobacteridae bacterium]|nr:NADP oxidoreductase [Rubrobacteridae bacterium]